MKIYTKTGDAGQTGLFAGPRVWKDDPRIEAQGSVDELNSLLGLARGAGLPAEIDAVLERAQHLLFVIGAELATPTASKPMRLDPAEVGSLERVIDRFDNALPPLREFILPGGVAGACWLHLARAVCRRAERRVVTLARGVAENSGIAEESLTLVCYLNRLGDLLFVLARSANAAAGAPDIPWRKELPSSDAAP